MRTLIVPLILLAAACDKKPPIEQRATPVAAAAKVGSPVKPITDNSALPVGTPGTPGGLPDDRTPLAEPNGPIDPKSPEGAGQVVQLYAARIEAGKIADAQAAWRGGIDQGALAPVRLEALRQVHFEIGKPFDQEGAAGSSYIEVPLRMYGLDKAGKRFNLVGPVTLRRVNDVDGATPDQLRWHIVDSKLVPRP